MREQIMSDLQVMANAETRLGEVSEKIRNIQSQYKNLSQGDISTWKGTASSRMFTRISLTSRALSVASDTLAREKTLIETARKNFEKAENIASQAVGKVAEKALSTANMFKN